MSGSWVEDSEGSGFGIENLPYGVFSLGGDASSRLGVRIGACVLDLRPLVDSGDLPAELAASNLNPLLAAAHSLWSEVRQAIAALLTDESKRSIVEPLLIPCGDVTMQMPFAVGDYVDFYSSEQHATNLGKMFRPTGDALLPNWRHLPVGYHGRAGTVVVSGTPIRRPSGQRRADPAPTFGPSERLDIELEMGFVIGGRTRLGQPIAIDDVGDHIFGMMLVNDWSARDIQAWEYQPLGPFLGKSFATSIAPWIVPMAALEPARVAPPRQDPSVLEYLQTDELWGFDIDLEVRLATSKMHEDGAAAALLSETNFKDMYWTPAQQLAHLTANGATVRPGDLCASGTISGATPGSYGSLIELSWNGTSPIELPDGSVRTFLEDGDEVVIGGSAGPVSFGEVRGQIVG